MKNVSRLTCLGILLTSVSFSHLAHAASFQGLGDLADGTFYSLAFATSADGSVVVGYGNGDSGYEAFRWTRSRGMEALGDLAGGSFASYAYGVSADGSVVVGYGNNTDSANETFRWTRSDEMDGLGDLTGGGFESYSKAVSADGSAIVGRGYSTSGGEAFRWTSSGGMVGLGDLTGGSFISEASAVAADGSVVVGHSTSTSGYEAFRWTSSGGMVGLGDLAGGTFDSSAHGVSADGSVIVGRGNSTSGYEAFRWTSSGGMVGLGDLADGTFNSRANAVSADGSIIVGRGDSSSGATAFLWNETNGMQNLRDHLIGLGVTNLTGWTLVEATGISADGTTIVGYGTNPNGDTEAWVANITPPWPAAITQFDDTPLLIDFTLKGYEADAIFQMKTVDILNAIADRMGETRPPIGTRLALHTAGTKIGKAFFVDENGAPLGTFDPIDPEIFSVSSSGAVFSPSETIPGAYKKSAWFEVNFALNLDDGTTIKLRGSVVTKTNYTDAANKATASSKLTLSGRGQAGARKFFLLGKGKASQKK